LQVNNFYYFRVRAKDKAGWVSNWSAPTQGVYKEGLGNPDFEMSGFGAWATGGALGAYSVQHVGPTGTPSQMVRLNKLWNPVTLGDVPVDASGFIWQSVTLPPLDCDQGLVLAFWYQIEGYDAMEAYESGIKRLFDSFDVHIRDMNGNPLRMVLRDGSPFVPPKENPPLRNLGWRQALIDLTPWAGQRVQIRFEMWNRRDPWLPTWVYIDDVRLLAATNRTMALPLVMRPRFVRMAGSAPTDEATIGERAVPWR
jgi:hypothetical protein